MKDLKTFFEDIFNDPAITDERLISYTNDHIARMVANNPGSVFASIIAASNGAVETLGVALIAKGGNIGDRIAKTGTKNQARKNFTAFIRQQEGTIKGKYGELSEPYKEFFPFGLTPFSKATDLQYGLLVANIVNRATQYVADLGAPFLADATALADAYNSAEDEQTTEKGEVSNSTSTASVERADLTKQLTINVLTIALQFILQPEKAEVYFDTSLLFPQHRKRIHKGEPAAGVTALVTKITYEAGKNMKMKNKGATVLVFQMFLMGNAVGSSFTVDPGNETEKKMSDFFSNADELRVTNSGAVKGKYEVIEIA